MFNGIIETVGRLVEVRRRRGSARLVIDSALPAAQLVEGESIAVDGACLTLVACGAGRMEFDAVTETLSRTTLGEARPGRRLNLERSLRVGARLDGHLVQGHVDAVVKVEGVARAGDDRRLRLALPSEVRRYVARKGSIALAGVSLTVAAVDNCAFEVALVPYTLERTTLGEVRPGDRLNLETDLIARYLERMLERERPSG